MRVRTESNGMELSQNLAPLIDVVFLLLVFFMVATTFSEAGQEEELPLDLPEASSGETSEAAPEELVITITRDGRTLVGGVEMRDDDLVVRLDEVARQNPRTPITLRGDREVVLQRIVSVMDACRLAGLVDVGLSTQEGG